MPSILRKLLPFSCILVAGLSVWFTLQRDDIPIWQMIGYTVVLLVPVSLILLSEPFDRAVGLRSPTQRLPDAWGSITTWIGWMILAVMILLNHFARPMAA